MTTAAATATPETETTSPQDPFDQAVAAALEEHSPKGEQATPPDASNPTETGKETAVATAEATPADTSATTKAETTGLLTDAEYTALETKHAGDPAGLRKALEGAFTKKTQAIAEDRRSYERLKPYADVIEAYEADPRKAIEILARQNGLTLTAAGETPATPDTTTPAATLDSATALVDRFKEKLGPEYEYMADSLGPALVELVTAAMQSTVQKEVEPLRKAHEAIVSKEQHTQADAVMKTLGEKHPDWKDHEDAMLALMERVQPNGMPEAEYLDLIYDAVTKPTAAQQEATVKKLVADGIKAALDEMKKSAAEAGTTARSTPEHQVRKAPPANATFEDAAEAARRGERWE